MSKKIITNLFRFAQRQGAHGLTIESRADRLALDYNFPGGDRQSFTLPKKLEKELMAGLHQLIKVAPGELTAKKYCQITDRHHSSAFQVTILPGEFGEKIIISQTPKNSRVWRLPQLGCSSAVLKNIQAALKMPAGLILISGSAASGRRATLYALLRELNRADKNIYLLGESPEETMTGINILPASAINWDRLLHHDSEIIAADNLDNPADLERALIAAGTGRLILGILSAASVWEALRQVLSLPLPLKLKLDSLKIITNQQLAKMQRKRSESRKNQRREIALFESLKLTPNLKKFILKNEELIDSLLKKKTLRDKSALKFWSQLSALAKQDGFQPLALDEREKIKNGILAPL